MTAIETTSPKHGSTGQPAALRDRHAGQRVDFSAVLSSKQASLSKDHVASVPGRPGIAASRVGDEAALTPQTPTPRGSSGVMMTTDKEETSAAEGLTSQRKGFRAGQITAAAGKSARSLTSSRAGLDDQAQAAVAETNLVERPAVCVDHAVILTDHSACSTCAATSSSVTSGPDDAPPTAKPTSITSAGAIGQPRSRFQASDPVDLRTDDTGMDVAPAESGSGDLVTLAHGLPDGLDPSSAVTIVNLAGCRETASVSSSAVLQAPDGETAASAAPHLEAGPVDEIARIPVERLEIGDVSLRTAERSGDMSIRLSLPNLGTVEVRVGKGDHGASTMTISADRPDTLRTMETDQAQLRAVLNQSGLENGDRIIDYELLATPRGADGGSFASPEGSDDRPDRSTDLGDHRNGSARQDGEGIHTMALDVTISSLPQMTAGAVNITA